MNCLYQTKRISDLKEKMLSSKRYASIEQARIITRVYQENEKLSIPKKRALSLKAALEELEISVEDEELIVGNRTKGVRYGVVFPESGCSWINQEFEMLPTRPQDQFLVKEEDIKEYTCVELIMNSIRKDTIICNPGILGSGILATKLSQESNTTILEYSNMLVCIYSNIKYKDYDGKLYRDRIK